MKLFLCTVEDGTGSWTEPKINIGIFSDDTKAEEQGRLFVTDITEGTAVEVDRGSGPLFGEDAWIDYETPSGATYTVHIYEFTLDELAN